MTACSEVSARVTGRARSARSVVAVWLVACFALIWCSLPLLAAAMECVSVSSTGEEGNGSSYCPCITPDGRYVAFHSEADNLVPDDLNGYIDVFVHDRLTGETERVSISTSGEEGNHESSRPAISADGRYVAFVSTATNLVSDDANLEPDIFLRDRETGTTERVSVGSSGEEGNRESTRCAISDDGRFVAFISRASNWVEYSGINLDVYIRDRDAGTTRMLIDEQGDCGHPAISAHGRFVAYTDGTHVMVYDRQEDLETMVSVTPTGEPGEFPGFIWNETQVDISADGRYVAFNSPQHGLVPDDTNLTWDVFLRDLDLEVTERMSVNSEGEGVPNPNPLYYYPPSVSADGRFVVFSTSQRLVPEETHDDPDVYLRDRLQGTIERVRTPTGRNGRWGVISDEGQFIAFSSGQIFVRKRFAADFAGSPASGPAPLTVNFTDMSVGSPTSWEWDFGDGGTSTEQNPSHTYLTLGSYTVSLAVHGPGGSDTEMKVDYVTVAPAPLQADFSGTPRLGPAPLTVQFTDLSSGEITSWEWDFGDGGTSAEQNPSHTYLTPGSHTVSLTVHRPGGSDTETKSDYITVSLPPLTADFSASPTSGSAPLALDFTDLSTNNPTAWSWNFGDGGTSTAQHPTHEYVAAGTYTVCLTATNSGGFDTETKSDYITVNPPPLTADFSASPTSGSAPLAVDFADLSTDDPTSWSWSFGDGGTSAAQHPSHQYEAVGLYTVTLTATNAAGSDTETKTNYIAVVYPDAAPEYWACEAILACVNAGIVSGYEDGSYHPDWPVTRDQMAVYIARALAGGDENVPEFTGTPRFPDVDAEHWALDYVEYAVGQSVVAGYDDGNYHPEYDVTRAEMAVYIARAKGWVSLGDDMTTAPELFPDVPAAYWSGTAIEQCVNHAVVQGYLDGNYHPDDVVTRAEMAVYIARAFQLPF